MNDVEGIGLPGVSPGEQRSSVVANGACLGIPSFSSTSGGNTSRTSPLFSKMWNFGSWYTRSVGPDGPSTSINGVASLCSLAHSAVLAATFWGDAPREGGSGEEPLIHDPTALFSADLTGVPGDLRSAGDLVRLCLVVGRLGTAAGVLGTASGAVPDERVLDLLVPRPLSSSSFVLLFEPALESCRFLEGLPSLDIAAGSRSIRYSSDADSGCRRC